MYEYFGVLCIYELFDIIVDYFDFLFVIMDLRTCL